MTKKLTTYKQWALELIEREDGLEKLTIAQVYEVFGKLCDMYFEQAQAGYNPKDVLYNIGQNRAEGTLPGTGSGIQSRPPADEVAP